MTDLKLISHNKQAIWKEYITDFLLMTFFISAKKKSL